MRLALIGVGLIGGSFARALRAAGRVERIVGFDRNADAGRRAIELGVIDEQAASAAHAVNEANLVMISTPVGSARQIFREIASHLSGAVIVTDVGSTKSSVIDAACREFGEAFTRFVPGHPIAGREYAGVEHSDAELFRNRMFVSTATTQTDAEAVRYVEALWREIGCRIERMTAEEHDDVFAAVSHLPHLLAFALVAQINASPDSARKFAMAGASFHDLTRIAASSPAMWADICLANRAALAAELSGYRALLGKMQHALEEADAESMQRILKGGSFAQEMHNARVDDSVRSS